MDGHFRAFTFVNRITALEPAVSIRGAYEIPRELENFSQSLVAESVGQLAAWAGMSATDFKCRPVAGIAGKIELLSSVQPGQTLEISADIEAVDLEACAYHGQVTADGVLVVRLENCVGPMLPVEDFDDPQALRAHFEVLRGNGSTPGAFGGIPAFNLSRNGGETGKSARATLQVPSDALFFSDHFPRRPVFPGTLLMSQNLQLAASLAAEIPGRWKLDSIHDMKLRSFIPPGEIVEIEAKLDERDDISATIAVEARKGKRLLGAAFVRLILAAQ